ncbi:MCE family protein [Nocardioides sp. ChNu-153]|uniref:MCE family protein n=1 Tax=unclassified Nocardioides TaxID=2615069 RepID=UPI002406BAB1|nr:MULTISPECIES: MCE family protein [unclassified Nocardioides]MDF9715388.1 MCE family protein [Nocardioides sp. ChNu-99]MDN7121793.1 MCE family protein [Nocardioides sp. ChNu-153]
MSGVQQGGRSRLRARTAALLAGGVLLSTGGCSVGDDGMIEVTAQFTTTSGLFVGNDVGVLGVPIGTVTEIEPRGEVVDVTLEIEPDADLPASAGALVMSRSVATDRYVEMTPAFADGPRLEDGAVIPVERTRTPIEFDEVLETLRTFSDGLRGPDGNADTLNRLLEIGAGTLNGRGAQLNETIRQFAQAADSLSANSDDIAGTIGDLDDLTTLLAENQGTINEFLLSVTEATELFAAEQDNFEASLVALSDALAALGRFSVENRSAIATTTRGLTGVLENLAAHRAQLEETIEIGPMAFTNVGDAVTDENRLLVKLPPQYFSPVQPVTEALCGALASLPLDVCAQLGTSPDLLALLRQLGGLLTP